MQLQFDGRAPGYLGLGWSTQPAFEPGVVAPLAAIDTHTLALHTGAERDWRGEVYWLVIDQVGFSYGEWTLREVRLLAADPGFWGLQRAWLQALWPTGPWLQRDVNWLGSDHLQGIFAPPVLIALWIALTLLLARFLAGLLARRPRPLTPLAVLLVLSSGWLALDLRWQFELAHKAGHTLKAFAGQTPEQRFANDLDGELFGFVDTLRAEHPRAGFGRVFVFGDSDYWRKRARYHLAGWGARPVDTSVLTPSLAGSLQPGDLLLLLDLPGLVDLPGLEWHRAGTDPDSGAQRVELRAANGSVIVAGVQILQQGDWRAVRVD